MECPCAMLFVLLCCVSVFFDETRGQVVISVTPPPSSTACFQLPTKVANLTRTLGSQYFLYKSFIPDCDCCWFTFWENSTNATYGVAEYHNGNDKNYNVLSMESVDDGIYVRANVDYPHETDLIRVLDFDFNQDNGYLCTYTCNMDGFTTEDLMCHGTSSRSKPRIENVLLTYAFFFPKYSILYSAMMCERPLYGNQLFNPVYYTANRTNSQLYTN